MKESIKSMIEDVMLHGTHSPDCNKKRWKAHIKNCPCSCYEELLVSLGIEHGRTIAYNDVLGMVDEVTEEDKG